MSIKRTLPHFRQPENSSWCGATCLSMLYKHYGYDIPQQNILPDVIMNGLCYTHLMLNHLLNHRIPAMAVSAASLDIIEKSLLNGYDIMLLYRPKTSQSLTHWAIVSYSEGGSVFVNDPNESSENGINKRLKRDMLFKNMQKYIGSAIVANFTMLVLRNPKSATTSRRIDCGVCKNSFEIFEDIIPDIRAFVCPECGQFITFA